MPELIWYKRFPQDWMSDPQLGRCAPATRGIWADIIENCYLTNSAYLSGPTTELCRVCRCSESEFLGAISELKKHKVGEFSLTDGQHKIGCRRIIRQLKLKDLKRKAGLASATHRQQTPQQTPQQEEPTGGATRSASASASASEYASASASQFSEAPSWKEFWDYCQSPHCGIAAEFFAKEKYWAAGQDGWKGKSDWRAYARRVKCWWEEKGRPMSPAKNAQGAKRAPVIRDMTWDASKEAE